MGLDGSGDLILQHPAIALMSTQFPEMYPSPGPVAVGLGSKVAPESTLEPFGAAGWDHHGDLAGAFPEFGSGLMAMVPCFTGAGFPQPIAANCANGLVDHCWDHERRDAGDCRGKKRKNMSGCGTSSSHSSLNRTENTDCEQPKGASSPSLPNSPQGDFEMKKDGRRRRSEKNPGAGARKPGAKQGKDHRQNGEDGKEDYVHIRAKRGQATNSHSLAERVRREKISERMRFLQNLVPGCNKITGKAVMLDEIINYVQSLQRQVEFLSMKLAAVSPELNFDIVHLLSKDMLHSGGGCEAAIDFGAGMNSSTCHSSGFASQSAILPEMFFHGISTTPQTMLGSSHISQISPIPQMQANSWDEELHKAMQMGYIPHMSAGNSNVEPPGNHERSAGDP